MDTRNSRLTLVCGKLPLKLSTQLYFTLIELQLAIMYGAIYFCVILCARPWPDISEKQIQPWHWTSRVYQLLVIFAHTCGTCFMIDFVCIVKKQGNFPTTNHYCLVCLLIAYKKSAQKVWNILETIMELFGNEVYIHTYRCKACSFCFTMLPYL